MPPWQKLAKSCISSVMKIALPEAVTSCEILFLFGFFPCLKKKKSQFLKRIICSWGYTYRPLEKARKKRNCPMWFDCSEPRQPQSVVKNHGPMKAEGLIVAVSVGLPSQAQCRENFLVLCLLCEALSCGSLPIAKQRLLISL